jgi:hypothetical protein
MPTNDYWRQKALFQDEIVWAFRFIPRFRDQRTLTWPVRLLRDAQSEVVLRLGDLRSQAPMV